MVTVTAVQANWRVVVTTYTLDGREPGSSVIATLTDVEPMDAFDYAIHAQGYFRHAIQEMGVSSLNIDIFEGSRMVTTSEISRD